MTPPLWRRLAAASSPFLCFATLSGCGLGAGEPPAGVQLTVTRDAGADVLLDEPRPRLAGEDTVLRLLQRHAEVATRYGGAFVDSIDGLDGGDGGWLYWVDGVAADRGAASWRLRDGDRVWWDRRADGDPDQGEVPAVVGSFPAPLVGGFDGRAGTVLIECAEPERRACALVRERLAAVGARPASDAERRLEATDRRAPVRVVVARFDQLGAFGDEASGVGAGQLGNGEGIIVALRRVPRPPVWVIAGVDDRGLRRAAKTLNEPSLRHRVAVTVDRRGVHALTRRPR